jgi:putative membrane protein
MPVYGPWCGPWLVFPIIGLVVMLVVLALTFGPRGPFATFGTRGRWREPHDAGGPRAESALDILKRRYASGEITREQYQQMRRDIE